LAVADGHYPNMTNDRQCIALRGRAQGWGPGLRVAIATIRLWRRRLRTRRSLRELEVHHLADIGLTESDRRREGGKWFWQD
jgi:uncharacterized protein YjiS (DUF1127 family)